MRLTIQSRILDDTLEFYAPDGGGYIWLDLAARPGGWCKTQICEGGGFRGNTVECTPESFKADCRRWYRACVRKNRI